jgi:hypothetical protein
MVCHTYLSNCQADLNNTIYKSLILSPKKTHHIPIMKLIRWLMTFRKITFLYSEKQMRLSNSLRLIN